MVFYFVCTLGAVAGAVGAYALVSAELLRYELRKIDADRAEAMEIAYSRYFNSGPPVLASEIGRRG